MKNRKGFTLIECVSRLILRWCSLLKCKSYQFPIQVGSLTTRALGDWCNLMRGDNVAGGKSGCYKRMTLSQPKRQGKNADRRLTNYAGVVNVTQMESWMSGDCERRPTVRLGKPDTREEEMGECTFGTHRRKSRRYAFKGHVLRNWGDLDISRMGKREYKMVCPLKSLLKHIKESEMTIVPIVLGVSKASKREGSLAFSAYCGG